MRFVLLPGACRDRYWSLPQAVSILCSAPWFRCRKYNPPARKERLHIPSASVYPCCVCGTHQWIVAVWFFLNKWRGRLAYALAWSSTTLSRCRWRFPCCPPSRRGYCRRSLKDTAHISAPFRWWHSHLFSSISQRSFHPAWANLLSHLLSGSFTIYPDKNRIWFHDFQNSLKKIIADFCERFYPCRLRCFSSPLRLPPCGVPRYME